MLLCEIHDIDHVIIREKYIKLLQPRDIGQWKGVMLCKDVALELAQIER